MIRSRRQGHEPAAALDAQEILELNAHITGLTSTAKLISGTVLAINRKVSPVGPTTDLTAQCEGVELPGGAASIAHLARSRSPHPGAATASREAALPTRRASHAPERKPNALYCALVQAHGLYRTPSVNRSKRSQRTANECSPPARRRLAAERVTRHTRGTHAAQSVARRPAARHVPRLHVPDCRMPGAMLHHARIATRLVP